MKSLRTALISASIAVAATAPSLAVAQSGSGQVQPAVGASAGAEMTEGEIRKIDKEAGKLTIKHGEIKNLGMPPMTMVFGVKDKAMLDKVKPGDNRVHGRG